MDPGSEREYPQELSFRPFHNLPPELRCDIWQATWEPQIITLDHNSYERFEIRADKWNLPTSAHVNYESRCETLRHYKLSFAEEEFESRVWFNFSLDTLHFPYHTQMRRNGIMDIVDLAEVERLIVPEYLPTGFFEPEGLYQKLADGTPYPKLPVLFQIYGQSIII